MPQASSKYLNGLPLHRQEKIVARKGVELPRGKLARAHIRISDLLQPLYYLCLDEQQNYDITDFDGTRLQVLKEKGITPQSKSALCNDHARRKFVHAVRHMNKSKGDTKGTPQKPRIAIEHYRRLYIRPKSA